MVYMNKKGQESPLKSLFIALLLVAAAGFSMFAFINDGLGANYDTPVIEDASSFTVFQNSTSQTEEALDEIREALSSGDSSTLDIIQVMVSRGFSALITLLTAPYDIASTIINAAFESFGLPSYLKSIASYAVLSIVIFGIIALIMKVRA